jgi:hypothetical protein
VNICSTVKTGKGKPMRGATCCIAALLALIIACSMPPPLLKDDVPAATALMAPGDSIRPLAAFGDVRMAIDGELHRGSVEVHRSGTGEFSADFYAAFGIIAGSIRMENSRGTVCLDDHTYTFADTQSMDTLPLAWGKDLTMDDLTHVLLGEVPPACAMLLRQKPDSCVDGKKTISAVWKTDSIDIEATLKKRSRSTEGVVFIFKRLTPYRFLAFKSFSGGRAYKIELRENDRNYFSIRYKKLKYD